MAEPRTAQMPAGPTATMRVRRLLHDGAEYLVAAAAPGVATLEIRDAHGDVATVGIDRADARRLIDDVELVAGLKPTAATVDLATALEGSLRILLSRLDDDLDRTDPAAAARLRAALIEHLRSKAPLLVAGGAP